MSGFLQESLVQNPYNIPGVRQLADLSGMGVGDMPTQADIQRLFLMWGKQRVFEENVRGLRAWFPTEGDIPDQTILDLLLATGTLDAQPVRTIHGPVNSVYGPLDTPPGDVNALVTGATANWMQLRIEELRSQHLSGAVRVNHVVGVASVERLCDSGTELSNEWVRQLTTERGKTPTEAQVMERLFSSRSEFSAVVEPGEGGLEEQVRWFGKTYYPANLYVPTNANALFVPLLIRRVLREVWGESFDAEDGEHRLYFSHSKRELATDQAMYDNPGRYQRPLTMFSGLVRLLMEMFLLWEASR